MLGDKDQEAEQFWTHWAACSSRRQPQPCASSPSATWTPAPDTQAPCGEEPREAEEVLVLAWGQKLLEAAESPGVGDPLLRAAARAAGMEQVLWSSLAPGPLGAVFRASRASEGP